MRVFMLLNADGDTVKSFFSEDIFGDYPNDSYPSGVIEITIDQWLDYRDNQGLRNWDAATSTFVAVTPVAAATIIPTQVSNYQARAVLIGQGLFSKVDAALRGADQTVAANQIALQAWDYANDFYRSSSFVAAMGGALNLTSDQIDQLFIAAAAIQ